MAVLQIIKYENKKLRMKSEPVVKINSKIKNIVINMHDTMISNNGAGLAAIQIGIPLRICTIDLTKLNYNMKLVLINPEIISKSLELVSAEEGCLSMPGVFFNINRHKFIKVKGLNLKGASVSFKAEGLFARVLQHEIDHMDGILIIDKVDKWEKK